MSAESRLARGDSAEDVAKLFGIPLEDCIAIQKELLGEKPKKKKAKEKSK